MLTKLIGEARFAFSDQTQPLAERVIYSVFPCVRSLLWANSDLDNHELIALDYQHGIDVIASCAQKQSLSFQIKCLNQTFRTVTIESKGVDKFGFAKPSDWESCLAQFTVYIYSLDGETIDRYAVIDNARLAILSNSARLIWNRKVNHHSRSEFKYLPLTELLDIAPDAIYAYGGDWGIG